MATLTIYNMMFSVLALGIFISSLEYLVKVDVFADKGLLSWNIVQIGWHKRVRHGLIGALFAKVYSKNGLATLFFLRLLLLVFAFFSTSGSLEWWVAIVLLVINLLATSMITFYGSDGSDQMTVTLLITFGLCCTPFATRNLLLIGIWFIALQSCLSYAAAGIAKLVSKEWQSGTAVYDIFSTKTYGSRWAARLLKKRRGLNVVLCWSVILFETLFPLCLFLPWPYALIFLVWGFTFHLLNAVVMGLNSFLWAFLATYPAILFINQSLTT